MANANADRIKMSNLIVSLFVCVCVCVCVFVCACVCVSHCLWPENADSEIRVLLSFSTILKNFIYLKNLVRSHGSMAWTTGALSKRNLHQFVDFT